MGASFEPSWEGGSAAEGGASPTRSGVILISFALGCARFFWKILRCPAWSPPFGVLMSALSASPAATKSTVVSLRKFT